MDPHLFVYGTLMTSAARARLGRCMRSRLSSEAESLGEASAHGRLYDLGAYPGLVLSVDVRDVVHGEVFRMADPSRSFPWLDAYENVDADSPDNEYERRLIPVRLVGGQAIKAWAYVMRRTVSGARRIASGRWQPS